jgi:hypothetical protein
MYRRSSGRKRQDPAPESRSCPFSRIRRLGTGLPDPGEREPLARPGARLGGFISGSPKDKRPATRGSGMLSQGFYAVRRMSGVSGSSTGGIETQQLDQEPHGQERTHE